MFLSSSEFIDLLHSEVKLAFKEAITEMGIHSNRSFIPIPQARYLSRKQTAEYLDIGLSTVDYWARIGKLHKIFIEDAPRFDRDEIDKSFSELKKFKRAA